MAVRKVNVDDILWYPIGAADGPRVRVTVSSLIPKYWKERDSLKARVVFPDGRTERVHIIDLYRTER